MADQNEGEHSSVGGWEQALINEYYDYRWHKTLEPVCDWMQRWKKGELSHAEMEAALEETHQQICEARSLFAQRQDRLVLLVQYLDREWFESWVTKHSPPPGAQVLPSRQ